MAFSVSYKFGIVAMFAGLLGVPLGSFLAQHFRKTYERADPIICAWGLFISAPMVYLALILARYSDGWTFFVIFLAELSLNLCWSIVADILLVSNKTNKQTNHRKTLDRERAKIEITKCGKLTIYYQMI